MRLESGAKIKNYEIISLLGEGGMGEVYLARDTKLDREVAIKFLRTTDDREKISRFRREAKVISSLNHPNIVMVFEFIEHEDQMGIVTEYVRGQNLRRIIAENSKSIDECLDIAIQIGNALAAAHEANIIHRDIKPENIMVLPDGYVKVLDFGLAKLVGAENFISLDDEEKTNTLIETRSGTILGTIWYMSPEQLRSKKKITGRTDIWSLGIILYEMLVRKRPFGGESASDIIVSVLNNPLPPIEQISPEISPEIISIIKKCLEKDENKRYESAKDLVSDLKKAKLLYSISQSKSFPTLIDVSQKKDSENRKSWITSTSFFWKIPLLLVLFLLTAFGGYYLYQTSWFDSNRQLKLKRLPTDGDIKNAVISPDGQFIVYVQVRNGQESLWLRQTEESGGKELIPAGTGSFSGLAFSPDGKYIYYSYFDGSTSGVLYRILFLGGSRQEIARNVDSPVSFAPDGKTLAFLRSVSSISANQIVLIGADGGAEKVLAEVKRPEFFLSGVAKESLAFSPDGKTIVVPIGKTDAQGDSMSVAEVSLENGQIKPLTEQKWFRVGRIIWTENENELLVTAAELGSNLYQVFKIFRKSGEFRAVAPNLDDYFNLSLTKGSKRLLALTYNKDARLFTAPSENPTKITQITGGGSEGAEGVTWTQENEIIYTSLQSGNLDIWKIGADGKNPQQLTFDKSADEYASVSKDGKMVFVSLRSGTPHIWQTNLTGGGNSKQITSKGGESFPQITPDGKTVVFTAFAETSKVLWKVSADGGEPEQIIKNSGGSILTNWAAMSPDGKYIACLSKEGNPASPIKLSIVSLADGSFLNSFLLEFGVAAPDRTPVLRWMPDGKAVTYIATKNGISNLWLQPLSGGEHKQITDFSAERIFSFDWSPDGKQIIYSRGVVRNSLFLIEDF